MVIISKFNSFRRYTPPTCTLDIYHPQPFFGRWSYQSFPPLFSFQLDFDDPRVVQEDKISIVGDRNLLEQLRLKVEDYLDSYLSQTTIVEDNLSCTMEEKISMEPTNIIHITRLSDYNHLLYCQTILPHPEIVEVVLSNTQIIDLVNALQGYYEDATQVITAKNKQQFSPHLTIFLTGILLTVTGFIWWQFQEEDNLANNLNNNSPLDETPNNNLQKVIPPSPLNQDRLPQTIAPKIPPQLNNLQKLPPNPIASPNPPLLNQPNQTSNNTTIDDSFTINNSNRDNFNNALLSIVPKENISLTPKPTPKQQSKPIQEQLNIATIKSLPVLSPLQDETNSTSTVNNSITNDNQSLMAINLSSQDSRNIAHEVKQYFQGKWQVPTDLKQTIEYRLQLGEDGSLYKVTPIGQVATFFLDKTPIPQRKNETIISPLTNLSSQTVRLILSPNGNIQTFME
jgi:Domain of unknown function (DUF4335)